MARKMMSKEVVNTVVKLAVLEMNEGTPTAITLPDETLLGNVTAEKAQKELNKKHGKPVTIISVEPNAITYEMEVLEFIKYATVKEPEPVQEELAI